MFERLKYGNLKPKEKEVARENEIYISMLNFLLPILKWNDFPETVNTKNLSLYSMLDGSACLTEHEDNLISLSASPSGLLSDDGDFLGIKASSGFTKLVLDRTNHVDCEVLYNNSLKMPDYNLSRFAYYFSQVDLSLECNIKFARQGRAFAVNDDKVKLSIEQALHGIDMGKDVAFVSNNILDELLNKDGSGIQTLEFNNMNAIEKVQYLSNLHYDLKKRFLWLYGLSMNQSAKMAQQSSAEISNAESGTLVLVHDMMDNAIDFCERVNKHYGLNTSVELNKSWEIKEHEISFCTDANNDEEMEKTKNESEHN
ncbi:MAG: hypothetical protein MJ237_08550 [bacterium]|nr:hypothetical protein [bacterium]